MTKIDKEISDFILDCVGKRPEECNPFHSNLSGAALADIVGFEFVPETRNFIIYRGREIPSGEIQSLL